MTLVDISMTKPSQLYLRRYSTCSIVPLYLESRTTSSQGSGFCAVSGTAVAGIQINDNLQLIMQQQQQHKLYYQIKVKLNLQHNILIQKR